MVMFFVIEEKYGQKIMKIRRYLRDIKVLELLTKIMSLKLLQRLFTRKIQFKDNDEVQFGFIP